MSYFKHPERDDLSIQRGETSTTARPPSEDTLAARTTPQCPVEWRDAVTQLTHHKFASLTSLQVCKFVVLKTACVNSRVRPQLHATCLACAHRVIGRCTAYDATLVTQLSKLDVHRPAKVMPSLHHSRRGRGGDGEAERDDWPHQ